MPSYRKTSFKRSQKLSKKGSKKRSVKLNKIYRGDRKKFKVYVKSKGSIKKVEFGTKGMSIKKHIPSRKKSFLARHRCSTPGPKTKARYWSCKKWK